MQKNKKTTCPECGRLLRNRCFIYNPRKKIRMCNQCSKKTGTNIFYTPQIKGAKKTRTRYSNLNISYEEKKVMVQELMKKGLTYRGAWWRMNQDALYVKKVLKSKENKPMQNKEIMKKFLEGLK